MKHKKRQVQRNMIITYALSGIILTGILSFLSSRIMSTFLVNQSVNYATQSLDVTYHSATTLLDDLYSEFYFLFNEHNQVVEYKSSISTNSRNVAMLLQQTTLSDPLVEFISFYHIAKDEIVLSSNQVGQRDVFESNERVVSLSRLYEDYNQLNKRVFYHQRINERNILSLVYASKDATDNIDYLMVVDIDEQALSSLFTSSDAQHEVLIVNDENIIIADSLQRYVGESLNLSQSINNPMLLDEQVNYFKSDFENKESLVAFKKSGAYNFVFFHITPYDTIQQAIVTANRTLVWLFLLFVLANILVSLYASKRFYTPIQQIMDQFVHKDYKKAKNEFELIESAFTDLNLNNQINVLRQLFLSGSCKEDCDMAFLEFPLYVVVMIAQSSIDNQIKQQVHPIWPFIQIDNQIIAGVVLKEFMDDVAFETFDGVFGFSQEVIAVDQIRKNYRYALAAAQFTETLEHKKVTFYDEIYQQEYLTSKTVLHQDILSYIHENGLSEDYSADKMADEMGFSLGYVRQVFKEQEKISLNEYLIQYRIEKAKEMLLNTNLSGREISEAIGYADSRYFYTQFKRRVNMTIEMYRQQNKEGDHRE